MSLFSLSVAQQEVVDHRGADLQVIACAGSGKTEAMSRRVAALIAEGAEPASIVAFTFTERAAAELKERTTRRVAARMGVCVLRRHLDLAGHDIGARGRGPGECLALPLRDAQGK
jgi:superfamily I DNA/RNA helicase